jgi:tetratricopeptide (TPR) repeat protein
LAALLSGCATSGAMRAGQQAERADDFDRAVVEYNRAVRERPTDRDARLALDRAKLRASLDHFSRGRRLSNAGRLEESLVELQTASELNPGKPAP